MAGRVGKSCIVFSRWSKAMLAWIVPRVISHPASPDWMPIASVVTLHWSILHKVWITPIFLPIASYVILWRPVGGRPGLALTTRIFPFTLANTKENGTIVQNVIFSLKTIKFSAVSIAMNTTMHRRWQKNTMKFQDLNLRVWPALVATPGETK